VQQEELSHSLTDRIIKRSHSSTAFPPQPRAPAPSHGVGSKSTAAKHLVETLGRIWSIELDDGPNPTPLSAGQSANGVLTVPSPMTKDAALLQESVKRLVPSHSMATAWMSYLHAGPNKLFRICSPTESLHLLESFYSPGHSVNQFDTCLITWQLTCGALFYPDTDEEIIKALYKCARMQTVACIEKNGVVLLWVVPTLLLECVYLINSKPRNCWVILGKRLARLCCSLSSADFN
jgi:hypothetical protein